MKNKSIIPAIIMILSVEILGCSQTSEKNNTMKISDSDKTIKIVVTDSGLGGLSVAEDIYHKIKDTKIYDKVDIIFANALFDANSGYNRLTDRNEKIRIFNEALYGIEKNFNPDYIFVACNTLSVLYNKTEFSKNTDAKVITIVDYGVNLIDENLRKNNNSNVIIFGTKTTINGNTYGKLLINRKYNKDRIVSQACPELQEYIEKDPKGEETFNLISKYVGPAINKLNNPENDLYASLNCTHYGYSDDLWEKAFNQHNIKLKGLLNPNSKMAAVLFTNTNKKRHKNTEIKLSVVSKVKLAEQNINSMSNLFKNTCPELSEALRNYQLKTDLFRF